MQRFYTFFLFSFLVLPLGICTAQWQKMIHSFGAQVFVLANNNGRLFAAAQGQGLFYSSDNGSSWNQIGYFNSITTTTTITMLTFNGNNIYAGAGAQPGGGNGAIYFSGDNGDSWAELNGPGDVFGNSIAYSGGNIIVSTFYSLSYSSDQGNTWHIPYSYDEIDHNPVGQTAIGGYVYIGDNYFIQRSSDNGVSFTTVDSSGTADHVTAFVGLGNHIVAGNGHGILLSTDGGADWQSTVVTSIASPNYFSTYGSHIFGADSYGDGVLLSNDSGSTWTNINSGLPLINGGPHVKYVTSMAISGATIFVGLADSTVWERSVSDALPVELVSFSAVTNQFSAELSWRTATEINNSGFEVQRRTVSSNQSSLNSWGKVGFIQGNGTSNSPHNYSYADNVGSVGTYSYRLKQIDHNGAFVYSQEVQVTIEAPKIFALSQNYPDPFNPTTNIEFTVPNDGHAILRIYNTLGQEVAKLFDDEATAGTNHQVQFNGSNLASGIYFSRLEFNGKMQVKKMLLLK